MEGIARLLVSRVTQCTGILVLLLFQGVAQAALQGRVPLTPGGTDYQAYYDNLLNITWLANANLAATENFGVAGVAADGAMNWSTAQAWITALNASNHLGVGVWRLPVVRPVNGSAFNYTTTFNGSTDVSYNIGGPGTVYAGSTGSEMSHLYYNTLANLGYCRPASPTGCIPQAGYGLGNVGPFSGLGPRYYWSGTTYAPDPSKAWFFAFDDGSQWGPEKFTSKFAWPVVAGDIGQLSNVTTGTFTINSATFADLYSATFDGSLAPCGGSPTQECTFFGGSLPAGRATGITNSGTGGGSLNLAYDSVTGEILQVNSMYIALPELVLAISFLGSTTINLIPGNSFPAANDIPFIEAGNGTLDRDLDGTLPGTYLGLGTPDPDQGVAVGQPTIFQHNDAPFSDTPDFAVVPDIVDSCAGPVCPLIYGALTFDGVRYRLQGVINGTGESFLALKTQTANNSIYSVNLSLCPEASAPGVFCFVDQTNVQLATLITSNTVTITGIAGSVPISVTGGEYSIGCTNTFTSETGTIANGQTVCVRHLNEGGSSTLLNVAGVTDAFTTTTAGVIDSSPEPYSFELQTNVWLSDVRQSNAITITGISAPTPIRVAGGVYSIGCFDDGLWDYTASPGLISNGQTVCVQHMSSGSSLSSRSTVLTVGDTAGSFTSTTLLYCCGPGGIYQDPLDVTPNLFSFPDQMNVPLSSPVVSAPVTIGGLSASVPISAIDGAYSIGCNGTFTSAAGSFGGGTVCVRHTSAPTPAAQAHTVLKVGTLSDRFTSVTTSVPPADSDGDGVANTLDNCINVPNGPLIRDAGGNSQWDTDGDGYGNLCDADLNNSDTVTTADFGLLRSVLGQSAASSATAAAADMNGSGTVTTADFGLLRARLGTAPGPSGVVP